MCLAITPTFSQICTPAPSRLRDTIPLPTCSPVHFHHFSTEDPNYVSILLDNRSQLREMARVSQGEPPRDIQERCRALRGERRQEGTTP